MPKPTSDSGSNRGRPYLGVQFECCGVYARIYRKSHESVYEGRCPRCLRSLTVKVDPQTGVASRFLRAR